LFPDNISIALDDRVGAAAFKGLFREEGGVDTAVDYGGAALPGLLSDVVSAESVAGVNTDAYDVSGRYGLDVEWFEGLVYEDGITHGLRCSGGQDEQPARGDHGCSEGVIAGVDKMNTHSRGFQAQAYCGV
jgi:hypothetical protein